MVASSRGLCSGGFAVVACSGVLAVVPSRCADLTETDLDAGAASAPPVGLMPEGPADATICMVAPLC
jgi:hypothetical protein